MLEVIIELLANEGFVIGIMAILICALTQLIKMPIKALSKKIASTEKGRNRINVIILLIPFALGCLLEWLYAVYYSQGSFDVIEALSAGTSAITLYAVLNQLFKGKQDSAETDTDEITYDSDEGKAVLELVQKVTEDGKIDKNDIDAVKDFWDTINK